MNDENRAYWDALAAVHGEGADDYYDVEALVAGTRGLLVAEEQALSSAVGEVAGKDVLHLQCHIGFDAVTLAQRGATVVGADFSPAALEKARAIAARAGVQVEYVEADSTALPTSLHDRFDLVWATIGVLNWIGDLDAWMRSAAAVLRPGGSLIVVELHPLFVSISSRDPLVLDFPYAGGAPTRFDEDGSYANPDAKLDATTTVEFAHSLGEVVSAAVGAGLRVDVLREHLETEHDPRGDVLARDDDGRYRLRLGGGVLPVLYTLIASRP